MYKPRGCVVERITAQPLLLIQRFLTPFTKMVSDRQGCIGWGLPFPEIFLLDFPPFPEIFLPKLPPFPEIFLPKFPPFPEIFLPKFPPFPEIFLPKFPPFPEIFLLFIQVYYALLYSSHIR